VAALYCSCEQQHPIWGSSGGFKESTNGSFSTIRCGVRPTPNASFSAPPAACVFSACTLMRLRARQEKGYSLLPEFGICSTYY
jgi:hypothetical protein